MEENYYVVCFDGVVRFVTKDEEKAKVFRQKQQLQDPLGNWKVKTVKEAVVSAYRKGYEDAEFNSND